MASQHFYPTDEVYRVQLSVDVKLERLTDYFLSKHELEVYDREYVKVVIQEALISHLVTLTHQNVEVLDRLDVVEWSVAKAEVQYGVE